jgi:hypothetical protein
VPAQAVFRAGFAASLVVGLLTSHSSVATGKACEHRRTSGAWTTVDVGGFPKPPVARSSLVGRGTAGFVVPGGAKDRFFATDGFSLLRSIDGGCNWRSVFTLNEGGPPASDPTALPWQIPTYVISAVAAPVAATVTRSRDDDVYLTLMPADRSFGQVARPVFVGASHDGGLTWRVTELFQQVALLGQTLATGPKAADQRKPVSLVVSPSDPRVAYLLFVADAANAAYSADPALSGPLPLFSTHDGGNSWQLVPVVSGSASSGLRGLVVSATNPQLLWANGTFPVSSTDGGRHWTAIRVSIPGKAEGFVQSVRGLTVQQSGYRPPRLAALMRVSGVGAYASDVLYDLGYSPDGGRSWQDIGTPFPNNTNFSFYDYRVDPRSGDVTLLLIPFQASLQTYRYSQKKRTWLGPFLPTISSPTAPTDDFSGQDRVVANTLVDTTGQTLLVNPLVRTEDAVGVALNQIPQLSLTYFVLVTL